MAQKSEKLGVVISNKMQKSIVVAVEWQVRHGLYGKTERRTMAPPADRPPVKLIQGDPATQAKELIRLLHEEAKVI